MHWIKEDVPKINISKIDKIESIDGNFFTIDGVALLKKIQTQKTCYYFKVVFVDFHAQEIQGFILYVLFLTST